MQLTFEDSRLILSDSRGIYIPRDFCEGMGADDAARIGVSFDDVLICQAGPDHEWYWESWQSILDSANVTDANGNRWQLYQSGDLWEIPADCELPDYFYA
jgi:hypothetical protein